MHRSLLLALALPPLLHAAAPDWENPAVFQRNRLPAQATTMPYPDRATALAKARLESPWCQSLNGPWKFHYSGSQNGTPAGFEKPGFDTTAWKDIPVPSNWQLQGNGIPLYSGNTYPFAKNPPKVTDEPPANYTNHPAESRHPVGSYLRTFNLPADWQGRRTVIAFEGVDSAFDLWINGEKAGYSEDSRTTARFDITPLVKPGENAVAVQVHQYSDGSYLESQDTWKLSGIYRDVYLVSAPQIELTNHFLKADFTADGKGALDLKATLKNHEASPMKGRIMLELLDAAETQITFKEGTYDLTSGAEISIPLAATDLSIQGWSAEKPTLYRYVITLADEAGKPFACFSGKTGFRRDEIKDGKLLHNGQPVRLKGVVRHDHNPRTGHVMSVEDLRAELLMMKQANLNAIRFKHAPASPAFLDLCDELGFHVIDEPNLDSSGMGDDSLQLSADWKEARLERVKNLMERDKNHPSVIAWLPEAPAAKDGGGALSAWLRQNDPSRPTLAAGSTIPLLHSRALGNSMGGFTGSVTSDRFQGTFIEDWRDEILLQKQAATTAKPGPPRMTMVFGGDSGDQPNAGTACASGVISANQTTTPVFEEIKKDFQDIRTALVDGSGSNVKIRLSSDRFFTMTSDLKGSWKLLKDGKDVGQGELSFLNLAPQESRELTIATNVTPDPSGEYILRFRYDLKADTAWYPAGMPAAWDEIVLPWGKRPPAAPPQAGAKAAFSPDGPATAPLVRVTAGDTTAVLDKITGQITSLKRGGSEILLSPLRLDFWRVPTQTDKVLGVDRKSAVWRDAGANARIRQSEVKQDGNDVVIVTELDIPAGKSSAKVTWRFTGTGELLADADFRPDPSQPEIPRIGFTCSIPAGTGNWTWYGKGPHDNYADRQDGAWTTVHTGQIPALVHRYPVPQESGNRTNVRWSTFENPAGGNGLRIDATGDSLLEVSAMLGSPAEYEAAHRLSDLSRPDRITLHFDHRQMGVGGVDDVPRESAAQARLTTEKPYHWSFMLGTTHSAAPPALPRRIPGSPDKLPIPGLPREPRPFLPTLREHPRLP
ncbi:DUF4981 domain-containing protein [Luteolibacter ambystomatis]|uniref:beta-galactosidase n=1 Tax=Luteolibacter ambystomatis TaxID=2824561 RepID=A0A975J029_9BACT|nr:glycoside hydrolase family 2 TIM barrel-domain containing protein [Luteolibacter ambystomatis]QUE51465.1 DUF4981 domain-containing protein [Luteolibacter ambystomatis]